MASNRFIGLVLIALGLALLLMLTTNLGGEVILGFLGVGFLVAYVVSRRYGYLVPGAILTGLGTGLLVSGQGGPDVSVVLGLGAGFLAIAVVDRLVGPTGSGWWWPFIPGGVLLLAGVSTLIGVVDLGRYLVPVALIVIGAALLVGRGRSSSSSAR